MLHEAGHAEVGSLRSTARGTSARRSGSTARLGERVGEVWRLRNVEYVFVAGPTAKVDAAMGAVRADGALGTSMAVG